MNVFVTRRSRSSGIVLPAARRVRPCQHVEVSNNLSNVSITCFTRLHPRHASPCFTLGMLHHAARIAAPAQPIKTSAEASPYCDRQITEHATVMARRKSPNSSGRPHLIRDCLLKQMKMTHPVPVCQDRLILQARRTAAQHRPKDL
jgi:hypothetical protein